tara:strand:- start:128 stop:655 length:528 start_codon:yes stop_codon:yes gene_type:complete
MGKILDDIRKAAGDKQKSVTWYRNKIKELGAKVSSRRLINQGPLRRQPSVGKLNFFFYDPKLKNFLPYYDRFPLVLPIGSAPGGFLGINFHYLPIALRVRLLEALDNKNLTAADYSSLKRINLIKPTIKHYLTNHVRSGFLRIEEEDFLPACLLPVQQFQKASMAKVHSDSRRMI